MRQTRKLWRMLDEDDSGSIDYRTFCIKVFPEYEVCHIWVCAISLVAAP